MTRHLRNTIKNVNSSLPLNLYYIDLILRWLNILGRPTTTGSSLQEFKTTFDRVVTALRWIATNGLRLLLQFWFAKRPLFWVPSGWVPGYIEWLLAFPRAPRGSVSIQVWGIACATVVQLAGAAIVAAWVLVNTKEERGRREETMVGGENEGEKEL